jgi:MFS superfamily sulfate permease-like transporter
LLYHVVFCLALASAIMRPNSSVSILGLMTKTAALGTLAAAPVYWTRLSQEVPALYPTADLFLAPFLAKLAAIVDQTLSDDASVTEEENDAVFLASFGVLVALGTATSACLILAAGVFQLANMGSYLPFPVICGFFSAVGILTWTLAVNVDTGGHTIGAILTSHDGELVRYAMIHHVPTIVVAGFMKYLGPKNPFFVCLVVVVTIALFYVFMFVTGATLEEMKEEGWFWSHDELVYENFSSTLGFDVWAPPAPCGVMVVIHQVHWGAVKNGFSTAIAMSFLYLIRCSVCV